MTTSSTPSLRFGRALSRLARPLAAGLGLCAGLLACTVPAWAQQPAPTPTAGQPTAPTVKTYVDPVYPEEAKKKGVEATIVLELDVARDGSVKAARVVQGAEGGFDEAATDAAKKLVFEPAKRADGSPMAATILFRYTFTLKVEPPATDPAAAKPEAPPELAALRGTILVSGADVPIAGAVVTLRRTDVVGMQPRVAPATAELGAFDVGALAPGTYSVTVQAPGYEPLAVDETLSKGETLDLKYRLVAKGSLEVIVRGAKPPREVTKRTVEQREISRIPGTNGDALRAIQNFPGVARPPGLAGLLLVRGSAAQDTLTFIDGTPVPLIYHFGGLSSVVPTEMLEKIDFYPGNFSAVYGRAQGGIVDVGLKSPPSDKLHGLVQVDNIDVRALLQGPVPFLKGWTFSAAGRRAYFGDTWLPNVLQALGAGATQGPVYYDYQFLLETKPTPDSLYRVSFFGSDDGVRLLLGTPGAGEPALSGNAGFSTAFKRLQMRYEHRISDDDEIRFVAAAGEDNINVGIGNIFFKLDNRQITGRGEYSHRFGKGARLNTGIDMQIGQAMVRARLPPAPAPGQPPNQPLSTRPPVEVQATGLVYYPAAYAEMELTPDARVRLVPGFRIDYFNTTKRTELSPRMNARVELRSEFPKTTLKGGAGIFHQQPQPQETLPPFGTAGLRANRAIHYSLGLEQQILPQFEVSLEGFVKQLDSQVVQGFGAGGGNAVQYANSGEGLVVGGELLARYKASERDPFFGWIAYTLSRSTRVDRPGAIERLVPFDQTHILTALGSYRLGSGWEFGARFRLISGSLVTPNVCDASSPSCDPNQLNGLFHAASGAYTAIPSGLPASERLPLFHQLDLRIDKKWKFKDWSLSGYLDILNVYAAQNVEGLSYNFNFSARATVSGLPILPQLGLRGEF